VEINKAFFTKLKEKSVMSKHWYLQISVLKPNVATSCVIQCYFRNLCWCIYKHTFTCGFGLIQFQISLPTQKLI